VNRKNYFPKDDVEVNDFEEPDEIGDKNGT